MQIGCPFKFRQHTVCLKLSNAEAEVPDPLRTQWQRPQQCIHKQATNKQVQCPVNRGVKRWNMKKWFLQCRCFNITKFYGMGEIKDEGFNHGELCQFQWKQLHSLNSSDEICDRWWLGIQVWVFFCVCVCELLWCCASHLCGEKLGALCCVGGQCRFVFHLLWKQKTYRKDFPFHPARLRFAILSLVFSPNCLKSS